MTREELILKAKTAKSEEELLALAKENGMELSEESVRAYFEQMHKTGELADDELDNVAGGWCYNHGKPVVTVEEHSVIGGLGSAVCDCLSAKAPTTVLKIGVNDVFGESGSAAALVQKYGLDAEGVYKSVKEFL